jgi:hypothetical protein
MNARTDGKPKFFIRRYPYGVSYRKRSSKPWIVKFKRNKRTVYVGSYITLEQASLRADEYLRNERHDRARKASDSANRSGASNSP